MGLTLGFNGDEVIDLIEKLRTESKPVDYGARSREDRAAIAVDCLMTGLVKCLDMTPKVETLRRLEGILDDYSEPYYDPRDEVTVKVLTVVVGRLREVLADS